MKTLVIGASENEARYSNKAIKSLRANGEEVVAYGLREGNVDGVDIITKWPADENIETVTLYVGPKHQPEYYQKIIDLKPRRVIFNPGTENQEFSDKLRENGIEPVYACTLVMLSVGNYRD